MQMKVVPAECAEAVKRFSVSFTTSSGNPKDALLPFYEGGGLFNRSARSAGPGHVLFCFVGVMCKGICGTLFVLFRVRDGR